MTTTTPARRTSAMLAAIPRRTPVAVHIHVDPLVGTKDPQGADHKVRIEYQNRAARRAFSRARHIRTVAPALVPYTRTA